MSFELGRVSIINDTDCDVSTPAPETVLNGSGSTEDLSVIFPSLIKICQILSAIMARLFSRRASLDDNEHLLEEVAIVDNMLLDWRKNLPQACAEDSELLGADIAAASLSTVILHCIYYNALLVIHRGALFGKLPSSAAAQANKRIASADTVCLNASRSLAKCINVVANTAASWPFTRYGKAFLQMTQKQFMQLADH